MQAEVRDFSRTLSHCLGQINRWLCCTDEDKIYTSVKFSSNNSLSVMRFIIF